MSNTWPNGFRAYAANIGVKDTTLDFSVVIGDPGTRCSAMFTQSRFAGCSVLISREHVAVGKARGVVTISKNSNVASGAQGDANARAVLAQVAAKLGMRSDELLIGSTGVIGRQYPMDRMTEGIDLLDAINDGDLEAIGLKITAIGGAAGAQRVLIERRLARPIGMGKIGHNDRNEQPHKGGKEASH